ncbi:MAG TPA: SDR family oxidoreductase [Anaerolineae bacterium]|nr:SDR family oxidoreductase [Anaerolineae bacterium]
MKVLVTGTDGYSGTLLGPMLLEHGQEVVGLDTGFYRDGWLYNNGIVKSPAVITKDLRRITDEDLDGVEAVVHLAELSNDPLGQLNPEITYKINHQGSVTLAEKCKHLGITRFVYASSCSVYGVSDSGGHKTEESAVNPQTAYAKCKVLVENDLSAMADDHFSPTFLRNATAYGPSPRQRFDVVLNNLAGLAWTTKQLKLVSDGTPWRPLVHVLDICQAVACTLAAPREIIHNQVFNVGDTNENYRVREIAEIVADVFPDCQVSFGQNDGDNRSYRVSFEKINSELPGFKCQRNAALGALQMRQMFERINLTTEIFQYRNYTRLKQLQHLINTHQIDHDFYWKN